MGHGSCPTVIAIAGAGLTIPCPGFLVYAVRLSETGLLGECACSVALSRQDGLWPLIFSGGTPIPVTILPVMQSNARSTDEMNRAGVRVV